MTKFKSKIASSIEKFIEFRIASDRWNSRYEYSLGQFDRHCAESAPDSAVVTQDLVDSWSMKGAEESNNSLYLRLLPLRDFINYLAARDLTTAVPPQLPKQDQQPLPPPHEITPDELKRFFAVCDCASNIRCLTSFEKEVRRLTIPVFMRFQYSTGMRPVATRNLLRQDVDLNTGVVNVAEDKGHNQHYIVLHDSMLELLRRFDEEIDVIQPDRTYFFESPNGGKYDKEWVDRNFRSLWDRANGPGSGVKIYDLRHNYATQNMMRIKGDADMLDELTYVSMSMGHASINATMRYADLVPQLAEKIHELTGESFNSIVPEVEDEGE